MSVELDVVSVKVVALKVEEVVLLSTQLLGELEKYGDLCLHSLQLLGAEDTELLDGGEHLLELGDAATEEVQAAKDGAFIKVELLPFGGSKLVLRESGT